jgi:predicted DNA-binding transcriptional regulator AlpA
MQRTQTTHQTIQRRYVSEIELEDLTGVKRRTWQKHRLFGRGPKFYRLCGAVRYNLQEVLEWIESNGAGGAPS